VSEVENREGYRVSYSSLYAESPGRRRIRGVRVPLIQRDYAQGRPGRRVEEIRTSFLDVLHGALTDGKPVGLDFIYGDVDDDGTLLPLDGQQRLTTLFLLHWFLCVRTGGTPADHSWSRFSYDTRASARRFCERLVVHTPTPDRTGLAEWIVDQPWFLHGWQADPTIDSMLTMIRAIEERFADTDDDVAWARAMDTAHPAISFLLLPIDEIGAGDELYIKMNSRGKPLTEFENFKARVEQVLARSPERANALAHKIDGPWTDLLWPLRGDDDIVDDEFMRLLRFCVEVCEWREGRIDADEPLHLRAAALLGPANPRADEHLTFLFDVFDVWSGYDDVVRTFEALFGTQHRPAADGIQSVTLFGTEVRADLFADCCERYGSLRGSSRVFSLSQTLLLYAVILHRIHHSADIDHRLRLLRNLLASSDNQVRRETMPDLIAHAETIVLGPPPREALTRLDTFTQALRDSEREKLDFLARHPDQAGVVHRLEDHDLLRGSLTAFELDAATLPRRADAFVALFDDPRMWPSLTGALLAAGEYQRRLPRSEAWQFGTGSTRNDGAWRALFSGPRDEMTATRDALGVLLDAFTEAGSDPRQFLTTFTETWLRDRQAARHLDWRYHLVRYPCMREGSTGLYYGDHGELGYSLCMLRTIQLNGYYRDPFLWAIVNEAGRREAVKDPWFTGYPTAERWMELFRSGAAMRSVSDGLLLRPPELASARTDFDRVISGLDDVVVDGDTVRIAIARRELPDGALVDTEDRVARGATVLRALTDAGL